MPFDYKAWFDAAKDEFESLGIEDAQLEQRRAEIKIKRNVLAQSMKAIGPLIGEQQPPSFWEALLEATAATFTEMGLTAAIRSVLQKSGAPLSPTQIRDALKESGLTSGYANEMAAIHTVIQRLIKANEVSENLTPTGKTYRLKGAVEKRVITPPMPPTRFSDLEPVPDPDATAPQKSVQGLQQAEQRRRIRKI